jgi:hypothetical protein
MTFTIPPPQPFLATDDPNFDLFPMPSELMPSELTPSELTIAQAAEFLDGTEGLVHELIDAELIAFRLEDGERLVDFYSLSDFLERRKRRHAALNDLFCMFREAGMSDD